MHNNPPQDIYLEYDDLEKIGCRRGGVGEYGVVYEGEIPSDVIVTYASNIKSITYLSELSKRVILSKGELIEALKDGRAKKLSFSIPAGLLVNLNEFASMKTLYGAQFPEDAVKYRYFFTLSFTVRCCMAFRGWTITPVARSLLIKSDRRGVPQKIYKRFPTLEDLRNAIRKAVVKTTRWVDRRRKKKWLRAEEDGEVQKKTAIYVPTEFYERFSRVCKILNLSYGEVIAFLLTHIECLDDLEDAIAIIAQHESRYYKQYHPEASEEEVLLETARLTQIKFPPHEKRATPFFDFCQDEKKRRKWKKQMDDVMDFLGENTKWFRRRLEVDKSWGLYSIPLAEDMDVCTEVTVYDFYEKMRYAKGKINSLPLHEEVKDMICETEECLGLKGSAWRTRREKFAREQPALTFDASSDTTVVNSGDGKVNGAQSPLTVGAGEIPVNGNFVGENVGAPKPAQQAPAKGSNLAGGIEASQSRGCSGPAVMSLQVHTAANPAEVEAHTDVPPRREAGIGSEVTFVNASPSPPKFEPDGAGENLGAPIGNDIVFANASPPPPELRYLHFEPDGSYKVLPLDEGEKYKNLALEKWGRYLFGYYILVGIFRSYYPLSNETDGIDDSGIERRCPYCNTPFTTVKPPERVPGEFPPPGVFFCENCPAAFIVYQPHKDKIANAYWQPPSNKARLIPIEDYLKMAEPRALWDVGEEKAEVDDYDESVWRATHEKLMPVVEKFKEFVGNNRRHIRREIVNAWNAGAIWGIANLTVSLIAEVEPSFKSWVSENTAKLLYLNVAGHRVDSLGFELNYALALTIPHLLGITLLDGGDGEEFLKQTPRLIGLMLGVTIQDYKPYTNITLSQLIKALNEQRGIFLPSNQYRFNLIDDPDGRQFYITVEKVGSKTKELVAVGFAPGVFKFYGELDDGLYYFVMENGAEFVIKDYVPSWLVVMEPKDFALFVAREAARIVMRYESVGVA